MFTVLLAWIEAAYDYGFHDLFFFTFVLDWVLIVVAGNVFSTRRERCTRLKKEKICPKNA